MFFHGTLSSKNPYGAISNTYFKARAVKTTRRIFLDPAQNHRIYSFPDEALNRCEPLNYLQTRLGLESIPTGTLLHPG